MPPQDASFSQNIEPGTGYFFLTQFHGCQDATLPTNLQKFTQKFGRKTNQMLTHKHQILER